MAKFLVWREPGNPKETGRVEILPASKGSEPFVPERTASEAVIPAGSVLELVVDASNDPLPPRQL